MSWGWLWASLHPFWICPHSWSYFFYVVIGSLFILVLMSLAPLFILDLLNMSLVPLFILGPLVNSWITQYVLGLLVHPCLILSLVPFVHPWLTHHVLPPPTLFRWPKGSRTWKEPLSCPGRWRRRPPSSLNGFLPQRQSWCRSPRQKVSLVTWTQKSPGLEWVSLGMDCGVTPVVLVWDSLGERCLHFILTVASAVLRYLLSCCSVWGRIF